MAGIIETAKASTLGYNDKNWDQVRQAVADDVVYDEKASGRRIQGAGQVIEAWQGWATAIPDSKATFIGEYQAGPDRAVFEVVWRGKHTGPLHTPNGIIPASNKPIEIPACQVVTVQNGKIKQFVHYFDMMTLLTQIGAVKG